MKNILEYTLLDFYNECKFTLEDIQAQAKENLDIMDDICKECIFDSVCALCPDQWKVVIPNNNEANAGTTIDVSECHELQCSEPNTINNFYYGTVNIYGGKND